MEKAIGRRSNIIQYVCNCHKILLFYCKFQAVECWSLARCITLGRYVTAKTWSMTLSKLAYHFIPKPDIASTYKAFHAPGLFYQVYFSFSWSDIIFNQVQKDILCPELLFVSIKKKITLLYTDEILYSTS